MNTFRLFVVASLFLGSVSCNEDQDSPAAVKPAEAPTEAKPVAADPADEPIDIAGAPIDEAQMAAMFPKVALNAEGFDAAATSSEAIAKGVALLDQVAAAYRAAPAMTDTVTWAVKIPGAEQKDSLTIAFGAGQDMTVKAGTSQLTSLGGNLYFADEGVTDKFVQIPLDGTVLNTLKSKFDGLEFPCPHLALRGATGAEAVQAFNFGGSAFEKVAGYQQKDGRDQILLAGGESDLMISIDPQTKFISSIALVLTPPGAPAGIQFSVSFTMDPKAMDALATPIAFDPAGRTAVDSLEKMQPGEQKAPTPIAVGAEAPGFTLNDLDGKSVTLADLRGQVVVIDFWATWCGPCRKGLPSIEALAKWVVETKQPVKVFGINVWERGEDAKAASQVFWKKQGFSFPSLLDLEGKVVTQYGFNSIPATVIIGSDGKVVTVHQGFDPKGDLTADLKAEILKALGTAG